MLKLNIKKYFQAKYNQIMNQAFIWHQPLN